MSRALLRSTFRRTTFEIQEPFDSLSYGGERAQENQKAGVKVYQRH